jgi:hypothetical protein
VKNRFQNLPFKFNLQRYVEDDDRQGALNDEAPTAPSSKPTWIASGHEESYLGAVLCAARVKWRGDKQQSHHGRLEDEEEEEAAAAAAQSDAFGSTFGSPPSTPQDVVGLCALNQVDP